MNTLFFRLLDQKDKAAALSEAVDAVHEGHMRNAVVHAVVHKALQRARLGTAKEPVCPVVHTAACYFDISCCSGSLDTTMCPCFRDINDKSG